jgi:hypothetical protein
MFYVLFTVIKISSGLPKYRDQYHQPLLIGHNYKNSGLPGREHTEAKDCRLPIHDCRFVTASLSFCYVCVTSACCGALKNEHKTINTCEKLNCCFEALAYYFRCRALPIICFGAC